MRVCTSTCVCVIPFLKKCIKNNYWTNLLINNYTVIVCLYQNYTDSNALLIVKWNIFKLYTYISGMGWFILKNNTIINYIYILCCLNRSVNAMASKQGDHGRILIPGRPEQDCYSVILNEFLFVKLQRGQHGVRFNLMA